MRTRNPSFHCRKDINETESHNLKVQLTEDVKLPTFEIKNDKGYTKYEKGNSIGKHTCELS